MNRHIACAIMLTIGAAASANPQLIFGQQSGNDAAGAKGTDQPAGAITGRVVNESGQPMSNALVYVMAAGKRQAVRPVNSDIEGKFHVDDLPRGVYSVSAQVRGYVMAADPRKPTYYRPGESVNVVVKKGGVITGTVTNSAGEPVIGVPVAAIFRRDPDGRPAQGQGAGIPRYTDDRGVYRLFSLPPGTYLVAASTKSFGRSSITPFDEDVPTYYPSSTRDTASEVQVHFGSEATGIDIRYRGERGYAISGSITGGPVTGSTMGGGLNVTLFRAADAATEIQGYAQPRGNDSPFGLYGIGDGEYLLVAQRYGPSDDDGARSRPVRVKVKGQDVTGVELSLVSLSSIAGRMVLEGSTGGNIAKCDKKRAASIDESLFSIRRVQKEDPKEQPLPTYDPNFMTAPGEKGEFQLHGVEAGQYQVETRMLDETWYVRTISMPRSGRVATPIDVARNGFAVKSGERVTGLTISIAEGAASMSGKMVVEKGGSLPERLRVHLVPAELEAADDLLRFAESAVQADGTFMLTNLPPGRYLVIARQASEADANDRFPRPLAWNLNSRRSLNREAEALNLVIDLKPCQRVSDYTLRYTPSKEPPKAKRRQSGE